MNRRLVAARSAIARHHLALIVCAVVVYSLFATGYTWKLEPEYLADRDYFALQADAFLRGRLDLDVPSPRLDMSPYNGRIYLYYGLTNSLAPLVSRLVSGRDPGMIVWTLIYCVAGLALFIAALKQLRQTCFPDSPEWLITVFAAALAFGSPIAALAAVASDFHNSSIALSFACQMLAVLTWLALLRGGGGWTAVAFGLACGAAVGARMTNLFFLPGLFLALLLSDRRRRLLPKILISGSLVAVAVGALMIFNASRFGDPFETGMKHAQGFTSQRSLLYERNALLSPRWVPLNFRLYFLSSPSADSLLQELTSARRLPVPESLADLFPPDHVYSVDFHSVLLMTPLLLGIGLFAASRPRRPGRTICVGLGLSTLGVLLFLLMYAWASRRFTVDFVPPGLLLAFLATGGYLEKKPRHAPALRDVYLLLLFGAVTLHFPILRAGAGKATSLMMVTENVRIPSPVWPAVMAGVMGLGVFLDLRLRTKSSAEVAAEKLPAVAPAAGE